MARRKAPPISPTLDDPLEGLTEQAPAAPKGGAQPAPLSLNPQAEPKVVAGVTILPGKGSDTPSIAAPQMLEDDDEFALPGEPTITPADDLSGSEDELPADAMVTYEVTDEKRKTSVAATRSGTGKRLLRAAGFTAVAAAGAVGGTLAMKHTMDQPTEVPVEETTTQPVEEPAQPTVEAFQFPEAFAKDETKLMDLQKKTGENYFVYFCDKEGGILSIENGPDGGFLWADSTKTSTWISGKEWQQVDGYQAFSTHPLDKCADAKNAGEMIAEALKPLN